MLVWLTPSAAVCGTVFFLLMLHSSMREKERRATVISALLTLGNLALWAALLAFRHIAAMRTINWIVLAGLGLFALLSLVRWFPPAQAEETGSIEPYDERDHMFARNRLSRHPEHARAYYAAHPGHEAGDRRIQEKPELGEPGHTHYDPLHTPIYDAAFTFLERIRPTAEGPTAETREPVAPERLREIIARLARCYGAGDVGFVEIQPHHWYSHRGRDTARWGEPIPRRHRSAVVIVTAMDPARIHHAPTLPVILESSRQYVEAAKIALVVAHYLRRLGYDARAHTDGNYEVVCVPLAVDAGLGELGRMGILMHPRLGPCLRLAAVTCDFPFPTDTPRSFHLDGFCRICRKCADNCPSQAIPAGEEPSSRGRRHWSIRQEQCFLYWKTIGTDCAFCIRVCPFTKPDTLFHRLARFYVGRNPLNQRLALFFDDFLYGRRPPLKKTNPERIL